MPPWVVAGGLIAYLAAPVVETRLWRAGRMSDRFLTILLLARFPVLMGVLNVWFGRFPDPILIVVIAIVLALGYRWVLDGVREAGAELRTRQT